MMRYPVNPCMFCDGSCCEYLYLQYVKSRKRLYKNSKHLDWLKEQGMTRLDNGWFKCCYYHKENAPYCCDNYDDRPSICRDFMCKDGQTWIDLLEYGSDYY